MNIDDIHIDVECDTPLTPPTPIDSSQSIQICQCLESINLQLQHLRRVVGHDWRGHEDEYAIWLNHQRELVILRDRYYPDYQEDWGGGGGASIAGSLSSTPNAMTEIFSIDGAYQLGSIRNTHGLNSLDTDHIVSDEWGATVTSFFSTIGPGATGRYSSADIANQLNVAGIFPPIVNVRYRVRSTIASLPASVEWKFQSR